MDTVNQIVTATRDFLQSNPIQRALDALPAPPPKRPHHVTTGTSDRVEIDATRPPMVPDTQALRVKSARKLLAQSNGDMGALPPALQRALMNDLKARHPQQAARIERGHTQITESEQRDTAIIESEMRAADRKVAVMRSGANLVTMGGSEEAMTARELAEKGDVGGAALHVGLAGMNCAGAAVTWMAAGGLLRSSGQALSSAVRNPSLVTETLAQAPTAARTALSGAAANARNAPAALMAQVAKVRSSASSVTLAQAYDRSARTATAIARTLGSGEGLVQTAAAANTIPAAVSGARNLSKDVADGHYGKAALDVLGVVGGVMGARGTVRSVQNQAVQMEAEAAQRFQALEEGFGGHSAARHGPHVKDMQLTTRITTGNAPDNVFSPTRNASRFTDWIDQERTLAQAQRVAGPKLKALSTTQARPPVEVRLNHNRPLGTGFEGVGPRRTVHGMHGEKAKACETAQPVPEAMTGTQTTFAWREDGYGGRYVPVQHFPIPRINPAKAAPTTDPAKAAPTTDPAKATPTPDPAQAAPKTDPAKAAQHGSSPSRAVIEENLRWHQR